MKRHGLRMSERQSMVPRKRYGYFPGCDVSALRRSHEPAAFTLIELLTVILIIMVLAGLVVGTARYAMIKSHVSRARAEIAALEMAIENFKADKGYYPRTGFPRTDHVNNSGTLLYQLTAGPKKYFSFRAGQTQTVAGVVCIVDPFGIPYNYYTNSTMFELWSYGPDQQSSDAATQRDDIRN